MTAKELEIQKGAEEEEGRKECVVIKRWNVHIDSQEVCACLSWSYCAWLSVGPCTGLEIQLERL